MSARPFSVSVLSGKGGVGKTTICLNLARRLSQHYSVWLIDIDLFNRGTTSAIWESEKALPLSVAELIRDVTASEASPAEARSEFLARRIRECQGGLSYTSNLSVLPAARAEEGREASYLLWQGLNQRGLRAEDFLTDLLAALATFSPGCIVVLDGHGGLDELSIGAAIVSDVTYIVNEPDLITFTGSITLYHEISRACQERHAEPRIEFIINRVPPNKSVLKMERDFGDVLRTISPTKEPVAAYFPLERELFGAFGDDPFVSEIYTEFWFSKKIRLIADSLIGYGVTLGRLEPKGSEIPKEKASRERQRIRTALRREFYKRGDYILVTWLALLDVVSFASVWSLSKYSDPGKALPSSQTVLIFSVAVLLLLDSTWRWFRVQRNHIRNARRVRAVRGRRLRLGDSESARLREALEEKVRERVIRRGLRIATTVFAVLAFFAVLAIPNFLDALQKAKQKRTLADIRNTGTAMFSWLTDAVDVLGSCPSGPVRPTDQAEGFTKKLNVDVSAIPLITYDQLTKILVPQYTNVVPRADAWGHPIEYRLRVNCVSDSNMMNIRSPGRDGKFSGNIYKNDPFNPTDYNQDIVFGDGIFFRYPGAQSGNN